MNEKVSPLQSDQIKKKIKNDEVKVGKVGEKSFIQAEGKAHRGKDKNEVEPKPIGEGVPESVIQAERRAHNEDTVKADRKIKLPEKTYEALEKKAKAEGKTPDEKAAEIVERKARETEQTTFEGKINKYGFMHIEKALYEALGWQKGVDIKVKITRTANGIAVERA